MGCRIFVAHIDEGLLGLDAPGGDQHAFEELMRPGQQIMAVLEGPGLALVAIDAQIARPPAAPHELPFLARGEAGAAESPEPGGEQDFDHLVRCLAAAAEAFQRRIAAAMTIGIIALVLADNRSCRMRLGQLEQLRPARLPDVVPAHCRGRRLVAQAHAGRMHHAHIGGLSFLERRRQRRGTGHGAAQRVAYPDGDRRRRRLALLHHVEMMVEGCNLVDLGLRQAHAFRQCRQMRRRDMAVSVLDDMQMLDEEVAAQLAAGHQAVDLVESLDIDLAALGKGPCLTPSSARADRAESVGLRRFVHGRVPVLS